MDQVGDFGFEETNNDKMNQFFDNNQNNNQRHESNLQFQ